MMSPLKFIQKNKIAVALALAVSLAANVAQPMRLDDATFLETFTAHGNDLWSWAQEYWVTWSGRIVPHAVFMLLLSISPELVNILNAVMTTFSIVMSCMWVTAGRKENTFKESLIIVLMTAALFILTPTGILDVTVFWKTASVLYIWAFAAMLYVLLPFMPGQKVKPKEVPESVDLSASDEAYVLNELSESDKTPVTKKVSEKVSSLMENITKTNVRKSLLLIFPALYCAGFEPSGSFYFVFGGIMILLSAVYGILIRRAELLEEGSSERFDFISGKVPHPIPLRVILCWLVTSLFFFRFLSAPGNMVRFEEESLFWFPNYGLFTFVDKIFLGTCYTLGACLNELYLPMVMLSAIILLLMIVRKRSAILTLTAFLPALYYGLYPLAPESPVYTFVYNDVYAFYSAGNWFATFVGMFVLLVTAFLIFMGISDKLEFVNTLFFCGAILEQVVMGFTPTVAVSISRSTFFSRELLMIPLFSLLLVLLDTVYKEAVSPLIK